jgi:predicted metal-dependent hydrolase
MSEYAEDWLKGIREFNDGEYYACHDTLEALWIDAIEPDKKFYQGVLQITVGCHHLYNRNWQGAVILLGEGMGRLRYYQPEYAGINVEKLIQESYNLLLFLQGNGKEGVEDSIAYLEQNPNVLPKIEMISSQ